MSIERPEGGPPDNEAPFDERYTVTVYPGGDELLARHETAALAVYNEVFGGLFSTALGQEVADAYTEEGRRDITSRMGDTATSFVSLEEKETGKLVGFSFAYPDNPEDLAYYQYKQTEFVGFATSLGRPYPYPEYTARQKRTAMIGHTAILPEHKARGGIQQMMQRLETNLKSSGDYDEMAIVIRQPYAGSIRRGYGDRIITDIADNPSPIGVQTYFRIRL